MEERYHSDDESFEFVDDVTLETAEYVIPEVKTSLATDEIFGNTVILNENRPDHHVFDSSLKECQKNKKSKKHGNLHVNTKVTDQSQSDTRCCETFEDAENAVLRLNEDFTTTCAINRENKNNSGGDNSKFSHEMGEKSTHNYITSHCSKESYTSSENKSSQQNNQNLTDQRTNETENVAGCNDEKQPSVNSNQGSTHDSCFRREKPLSKEEFQKLFDEDGRLVDEHALRKAVFLGGVDPSIRKEVWHFLFGFFPCSSTAREREDLLVDYIMKYHEQKSRWKTMLMLNAKPGDNVAHVEVVTSPCAMIEKNSSTSLLEQGLVARYQIDTGTNPVRSPDGEISDPITEFEMMQQNVMAGRMKTSNPDFKTLSKNFPDMDLESPELKQKMDFMKIQAQVHVNRHNVNVKNLMSQVRVIDKDVPRTDRDQDYFKGPLNHNLTVLREILITFAAFYPRIGYAQGMNDILARFLVVFDSEVETYWCFAQYMSQIQEDFTEEGMVRKIELVVELLEEMDPELLHHLQLHEMGNLMFCHRWLLLGFKREMSFLDSLRCFEILSSHHLELSSLEAENARRKQTMKEFENIGGVTRTARMDTQCEYTFELFMCLALLEECRQDLLVSTDTAAVFTVINSVNIDLDDILCKSADLFYQYCKKSVDDSFLMVELPDNKKHRPVFR